MTTPRIPEAVRRLLPSDIDPERVTHFVHLEAGYGSPQGDTVLLLVDGRLRVLRATLADVALGEPPRFVREGMSARLVLPHATGREEALEVSSLRAADLQALLGAVAAADAPLAGPPPRSGPPPTAPTPLGVSAAPGEDAPLGPAGREAELRRRLARDPDEVDHWHGLFQVYAETGRVDPAWCVASALMVRGQASAAERTVFEGRRRSGLVPVSRRLSQGAWRQWVGAPGESPHLSAIFGLLAPFLAPLIGPRLKTLGLKRRQRRDLASDVLLVSKLVGYLSNTLDLPQAPDLYVRPEEPCGLVVGVAAEPEGVVPYLIVGADLLAGRDERELAFLLARALSTLRPEHWVVHLIPTLALLTTVFFTAVELVDRRFPSPPEVEASAEEVAAELARVVPPGTREALATQVRALSRQGGTLDLAGWHEAVGITANHTGLVLCGDLLGAGAGLSQAPGLPGQLSARAQLAELGRYAISEEYFTARQELGIALPG